MELNEAKKRKSRADILAQTQDGGCDLDDEKPNSNHQTVKIKSHAKEWQIINCKQYQAD